MVREIFDCAIREGMIIMRYTDFMQNSAHIWAESE
jgi:hypothetical protein